MSNIPDYIPDDRGSRRTYEYAAVESKIDELFGTYCAGVGVWYLLFYLLDVGFVI